MDSNSLLGVGDMSGEGAKRGFKRETIFVHLINHNDTFRKSLEHALTQLNLLNGKIVSAVDVKQTCKSDVKIFMINNGRDAELGCSLKAAEADFNQLDRRWLADWAKILEMPKNVQEMIQSSLDRKRINSREAFILPEQEPFVLPFFEAVKQTLFRELFTRDDENLQAFVAYDETNKQWFVAGIENIIKVLMREPWTRSSKGVLKIGDCLSLQRKGGDGNIKRPPKSSPEHPSNHLQFKIKPLKMIGQVHSIRINE